MDSIPQFARNGSPVLFCTGALISYLMLVRHLRFRRRNNYLRKVQEHCGTVTKSSELPLYLAEEAVSIMGTWDFPEMTRLSLQFALFRTYGIATISSILWKTRQLAERSTAHRRYVDTSILIIEFMAFPLNSPRAKLAIERVNYLHGRHKGAISNDDLLYTLSLFMCQPAVFIDKYEWRQLHPVEKMGLHRFWSEIGVMMGIQEIPDSFDGVYQWANAYEAKYMIPNDVNVKVAIATIDILLYFVPRWLHSSVIPVIHAVCDPRLRAAFNWPNPPSYIEALVNGVFGLRAFITRHCFLPRMMPVLRLEHTAIDNSVPFIQRRYYYNLWETDPWYLKRTWWNSYGPTAWICKIMGWAIPSDEFDSTRGFRVGDMGPRGTVGKGVGNEGWIHGSLLGGGTIATCNTEPNDFIAQNGGKCPMFMG
ncbi:hypothetical protein AA313_de0202203 [Arthrobotrys entomopaga]|nr:hypothetical protein AA313_de0202203 [Arthrobotrys entomopaga]